MKSVSVLLFWVKLMLIFSFSSFLYSLICSDSFQDSKTGIKINYPNIVFYIGGLEVIAHPQVMW